MSAPAGPAASNQRYASSSLPRDTRMDPILAYARWAVAMSFHRLADDIDQ
jgi:hypothetical protein